MRKNLVLLVLLGFTLLSLQGTGAMAGEVPMCRLGVSPVDTSRDVDWTSQCLLTLTSPQVVRMGSKSGRVTACTLATGTSVVIDKETGKAHYVRYCTNPLIGQPVLLGQTDCAPETTPTPVQPAPTPTPVVQPQPTPTSNAWPYTVGGPSVRVWTEVNGAQVSEVNKGTSVNVRWESFNSDQCVALTGPGFNTEGNIRGVSRVTLTQSGSYRFAVQCHGTGGYIVGETSVYAKGRNVTGWIFGGLALVAIGIGLGGHGGSSGHGPAGPPQIQ